MFDREQHTLNLPAVNSITYVLRFLEKLCHNLRSDNLFGNQPFTQNSHMQRSHEYDHDRYLPGRSWGGGGIVGTSGALNPDFIFISGGRRVFQSPLCRVHCITPSVMHMPAGLFLRRIQVAYFLPVGLISISACRFPLIRAVSLSSLLSLSPSPSHFLQSDYSDFIQLGIKVKDCMRSRRVITCSR